MWLPANADELVNGSIYHRTVAEYTIYPTQYILGFPQQVSVDTKTDALSRLVEAIEPDDSLATGIYSKAQYFYDALDRLTEIRHSDTTGAKIQYRTFSYDGYGRLSSETTPEGGTVNYTYTANDQVWQVSNQRNITVAHSYNTRGLVTNISYSDSTPQVVYNYDAYGARSSVTDGEGQTSYVYNGYRQMQSETRSFTGLSGKSYTLNYSYNQADQVKSVNYLVTIPGGTPGPPVTIQGDGGSGSCDTCSISGQVTNLQSQPVSQVTMTLSGAQSGQTTTNSNGQYSFGGLAAGETYTITPSQSGQVFDPSSRIYQNLSTEITNANFTMQPQTVTVFDKTINYAYNSVGALNSIGTNLIGTDPNNTTNVLNSVTFRATGALKQLHYGNGRRLTMGYNDQRNQPVSMKVDRISNPSDVAVDYEYEYYDANGNNNNRIRKVTDKYDPGYTTTYQYDKFNRLTNATATNYSRFYQFDPWGNITNFSGVTLNYAASSNGAPSTNRINTDSQSFSYSYDAAGNMTAGMGQSFTYDGANRLKTAGNGNSSFGYDGDGMRVKKSENGADTYYVKSSVLGQTAMEVNSTGVMRAFVYSGGKMVAMQGTDGQFYWLHTNHLGNARTMTDANGNVAYGGQFDPYGQTLAEWSATGNTNLNTKKFTGYERDAATGLDYAQARMYNSSRGRFTSPDPIGFRGINLKNPGSLNRYNYAGNDPVNFVDPNGETYQHWQDAIARSVCQSNGGIWVLVGFNSTGVPIFNCSGVLGSIGVTSTLGNIGNGGGNDPNQNLIRVKWSYTDVQRVRDGVTLCGQDALFKVTQGGQPVKARGREKMSIDSVSSTDPIVKEILGKAINRNSPDWGPESDVFYDFQGFRLTTEDIEVLKRQLSNGQEVVVKATTKIEITASGKQTAIEIKTEAFFKFDGSKVSCGAQVLGANRSGDQVFQ